MCSFHSLRLSKVFIYLFIFAFLIYGNINLSDLFFNNIVIYWVNLLPKPRLAFHREYHSSTLDIE